MDETRARARVCDRYYRAARIIAYKSRGARRPLPFPTIPYSPSSGPSPPSSPFPCMRPPLSLGTPRVPFSAASPLNDTTNNRDFSSVTAQDIATYARTYTHTLLGTRCRGSHGIFGEKKNLFFREKDREKEERIEKTRASSLHDFVSRCACMETKVRRGTLSRRGMEKE